MKYVWIAVLAVLLPLLLGADQFDRIRQPAGAGLLYPPDAATLRAAIDQYLNEVTPLELPGPVVACIVPHSSLKACGSIIANAVKPLRRGQYDRVVLLAPALFSEFRGCSIPSVQYYRTPLGDIELDGPAIRRVTMSSLIQTRSVVYRMSAYTNPEVNRSPLHEREFAAEVVLPFLQVQLGTFKLVPIVVGDLDRNLHIVDGKPNKELDEEAIKDIAQALKAVIDERTLLVVCSEFTRYGAAFNFTPFNNNIVRNIAALDMQAFNLVEARQYKGFKSYLADTGNPITGKLPILIALRLLPRTSAGVLMGYDVSARSTGNPSASVSYASIAYIDGTRPMPEPLPETESASPPQRPAVPEAAPVPVEPASPLVPATPATPLAPAESAAPLVPAEPAEPVAPVSGGEASSASVKEEQRAGRQ